MKVKLPEVHYIEKIGQTKNQIWHFIQESIEFESTEFESGRSFLKVKHNEDWYLFTTKDELITDELNYALKCNKLPTVERIEAGELKMSWKKHPLLKEHTPSEVLDSWTDEFSMIEEDKERDIKGLRSPQVGAIYGVLAHWKSSDEFATVVLPTGTGKTDTMICLLVANKCSKVLVTVPSDSLRSQLAKKFYELGLLKKFGLVGEKALYPMVGVLKEGFQNLDDLRLFLGRCNVVISTMDLVTEADDGQSAVIASECDYLFIDEAHHVKAKTWESFREKFKSKKVLQFTATPFRNDRAKIDGKFAFSFPLSKAQEDGYFKRINFKPVREYDPSKADAAVAREAIAKLREDREVENRDHILMARCGSKPRADEVFKLYEAETDLNPVKIYTGVKDKAQILQKIIRKEAKIIVCVDMLGEGFDLPELKIAAFHDIRKSLPITLQLAGRFTRTNLDDSLGEATIIANIADIDVKDELDELYAQDSDWNALLPAFSSSQIESEVEFAEFVDGFGNLDESKVPIQNIKPAFSTVVYKNNGTTWTPRNFKKGLKAVDSYEYIFHDINSEDHVLWIITGKSQEIDWGISKDIQDILWDVFIVFWDSTENLLFIHASEKKGNYRELANAVLDDNAVLIEKLDVYKSFHGLKRVRLQNLGLKEFLGRNVRFRMTFGADIEAGLSKAEIGRGQKAFVQGVGYEEGVKVSVGASSKGRIWSHKRGNVKDFTDWAKELGKKLNDPNIDANAILKNTLIPELISERPNVYPVLIDWDEEMYMQPETKFRFNIGSGVYDLGSCDLRITNASDTGNLSFQLYTEDVQIDFYQEIGSEMIEQDGDTVEIHHFKFVQVTRGLVTVSYGAKTKDIKEFFEDYIPTIWFADGSALTGNEYIELKQDIQQYPREEIEAWDWTGVDIAKEAQEVQPKRVDSIQYKVIEVLKAQDNDIIYDDDYSGEIADVLTIKNEDDKLRIVLYHLKFAHGGNVSNQIANLYEVCGQAQKSVNWKHKSGRELFKHLLRRETKKKNNASCSRIEKGTKEDLIHLETLAKRQIPIEFEVVIVQPSISKANASDSILTLLGVTENFLMEVGAVPLRVITSS